MRILCIHQNFPGQFRDLAPSLVRRGHELRAISNSDRVSHPSIQISRYQLGKPERQGIHPLTNEIDEWIRRSELVARKAESIKQEGWAPDVILAHPGWGETLLLREIFPSAGLILWPELWLSPEQMGAKFPEELDLSQKHYLRTKNGLLDVALSEASLAIVPTNYQAKSFPNRHQKKLRVN